MLLLWVRGCAVRVWYVVCDDSLIENGQQTSYGPCGVGADGEVGAEEVCNAAGVSAHVPHHVVARVFRRMMRLRRYMLQSAHVRLLAVDRLMALRRACEFRTGNALRWGECAICVSVLLVC